MTPLVACLVCARPIESLLTTGLHAGVAVLATVAVVVVGAIVRAAIRLAREESAAEVEAAGPGAAS